MAKPLLLIDADILLYRSSFSVQYTEYLRHNHWYRRQRDLRSVVDWYQEADEVEDELFEDTRVVLEPINNAFMNLDSQIETIKRNCDSDNFLLCVSHPNNFREEVVYPQKYKGGRPEKPVYIGAVKNYMHSKYPGQWRCWEPYEADDLIGIYMTRATEDDKYGAIICSLDKDLRGIPGPYYHLEDQTITTTSPEQAERWKWLQMLTGDRVDNILGIAGIGPAKSSKMLKPDYTSAQMEECVYTAYQAEFGEKGDEMFHANKSLLTILTEPLPDWPISA